MKKVMIICAALAAILTTGCTATKIEYERDDKGATRYSLWHNGHWLKTEAEELSGSMTKDGDFKVGASGLKSSPSEEFNKTMKTYTAAIVSMMQIAAAAYNPSSSAAAQGANATQGAASTAITVNAAQSEPVKKEEETTPQPAANAAECADCEVKPAESK